MGAPSAGLEVMESSGGYGNLRFDRLTPSNLEEKGKMTWHAPSATYDMCTYSGAPSL